MEKYQVIIGMEIHAELATKSKMFCACANPTLGARPNSTVCPICLGHPGMLPLPNAQAISWTVLLGLALHCKINQLSKFDRKNYFYPDLPKGYQISQYDLPLCYDGELKIEGLPGEETSNVVRVTRIHLEEDTGKLSHPTGKPHSLVDFNRAGAPLVELVTEPVIKSAGEAKLFCQTYQQILRYLQISDADMEKGQMRCEANVSLQETGKFFYEFGRGLVPKDDYVLNNKVEVKNINSFKAVQNAILFEIERQTKILNKGQTVLAETRGWNEEKNQTISQRVKETSADYRYFPEPDIPPISLTELEIDNLRAALPELPAAKLARFKHEYGLSDYDAELLTVDLALADYSEAVISELRAWVDASEDTWERQNIKLCKLVANWIVNELLKHLNAAVGTRGDVETHCNASLRQQIKIKPEQLAHLLILLYQDKINSSAGQTIFAEMYESGKDPEEIMQDLKLEQLDNTDDLIKLIEEVAIANPAQAEQYRNGKDSLLQFFVGKMMAKTGGKANPKTLQELIPQVVKVKSS